MSSCYKCRFYTGEDLVACGWNPHIAANSPNEGCWEFQPDPNPWGFWEWMLLNPPHVDNVQIGWVPIDGWREMVCSIHWTRKSCGNCAYRGLMKNPVTSSYEEVCAVNPRHAANTLLANDYFGGYQCPHWEPQINRIRSYKPVQIVIKHDYSRALAALAALVIVAIAIIGQTKTTKVDPYELSAPSSVQHIRED